MTVKEHYDNHLGYFYAWMLGDFQTKSNEFKTLLAENSIAPTHNKIAIDLGAGHGLQSIPLAEAGFEVFAVDFNQQLLNELEVNAKDLNITIINGDIKDTKNFANQPELIVCCGDTLSHLDNKLELGNFISGIASALANNGKLMLSFRDYATALTGVNRFIPVKSDDNRILTCILDYEDELVQVTDLLYERVDGIWKQRISSYKKIRLLTNEILACLEKSGMEISFNQVVNRMTTIIAVKGA
jgi:SAM-dependent methyltransferase